MTLLQSTLSSDKLFSPISSCWKKMFKEKTCVFFWLCFCRLVGVFGDTDAVKSVSVTEGDSVTLDIHVTEIQDINRITWTFGTDESPIAKISSRFSKIIISDDVPDGRFRGRLKVDSQTGSLTITNTNNTTDSGLYEVTISRISRSTTHRFTVTVYATTTPGPHSTPHPTTHPTSQTPSDSPSDSSSDPPSDPPSDSPSDPPSDPPPDSPPDSPSLIVSISAAAAAGSLLLLASIGIFCIRRKQRKTSQQAETREEEITYADPTFYKRNAPKSEDEVIYAGVVTRR